MARWQRAARSDQAGPTASPLTDYYAAVGTPPGRFLGRGLAGLDAGQGVDAGSVVTEEHLWRMLGMLQDPVTGQPLGRAPGAGRAASVDGLGRARKAPKTVAALSIKVAAVSTILARVRSPFAVSERAERSESRILLVLDSILRFVLLGMGAGRWRDQRLPSGRKCVDAAQARTETEVCT
jgi:hypothetical protein